MKLLEESSYLSLRQSIEHLYAVPLADCDLDLANDTNLYLGAGTTEFIGPAGRTYADKSNTAKTAGLDIPRFEASGLLLDSTSGEQFKVDADLNIMNFSKMTWHAEVVVGSDPAEVIIYEDTSGRPDKISITAGKATLYIQDSGNVLRVRFPGTGILPNTIAKLTFTVDGLTVRTYLNGIPGANSAMSFSPTPTYNLIKLGTAGKAHYRRFATWARVLTPEQISNL